MNWQETYQSLYDNPRRKYGQAEHGRCPGVRLYPYYRKILEKDHYVVDLGCGNGDTVKYLFSEGYSAVGYDFINPTDVHCIKANITEPIIELDEQDKMVGLCIDVFEHIDDEPLGGLIKNLRKCDKQIISVHNGPSKEGGQVELHINKKPFDEWDRIMKSKFKVIEAIQIFALQRLYLCGGKK